MNSNPRQLSDGFNESPPTRVGTAKVLLGAAMVLAGIMVATINARAQAVQRVASVPVSVAFPISCSSSAQGEFERGVTLLHHMTYPQAREAFQTAAAIDPGCAMAHWGIAMTLFQPLWPTRPGPDALNQGWTAVQAAESLKPPTERERLLIEATRAFYLDPASTDYWLRIRRWEDAMARAHARLPKDPEAEVFYALAILASAPVDTVSRVNADRAAAMLMEVLQRHPQHPGAMHYLVHANDMPGREGESLEVTRSYESVAPTNPHALHMPTHIYTRLGDWDGVVRGNISAAEAALRFPAGTNGEFIWDEFPHAIEYLTYAYLQQGADDKALEQLNRLLSTERLEPTFKTAFHFASTQTRYALERRAWHEAAEIVPRKPDFITWGRFPWPEAIAWFGRGFGAARLGDLEISSAANSRLGELEVEAQKTGEVLFSRNIRLLRLELSAWISHIAGRRDESRALLQEAVALEASTPKHAVTPGPTVPANELLGDLLMEQQNPREALVAYRASLNMYPSRFNSLLGAARAARASGDDSAARSAYQELLRVAPNSTRQEALQQARLFLGR